MPASVPRIAPRGTREPLTRSQIMSRIRSHNTRPEVVTRAAVHRFGLRFRNHVADLPGKPDLANKRARWAIFVHGCFWHSHKGCPLASKPKSNSSYWAPKLRQNVIRGRENVRKLERLGYKVLIVWECETRNLKALATRLGSFCRTLQSEVNSRS